MFNFVQFVLLGCFWGGSFIAIKFALESVPFSAAVFIRILIGLSFLGIVSLVTKKKTTLPKSVLGWVWLNGLISIGIPFLFLFWAENHVSAGLASTMNGTVPIWTTLLGFLFLRKFEKITTPKAAGVLIGLAGIVCIFYPSLQLSWSSEAFKGLFALLMMALLYASGVLLAKGLISGKAQVPVFASAIQQHVSSIVVVFLFCLMSGNPLLPAEWHWKSIIALVYLGVFSTGLAFMMFFGLVSQWGAVRASTVTYLVPTVCLILDFLVFGNVPKANELIGVAIVFSGIFLVQRAALKSKN